MKVGERYAAKSATVADLAPTALYALAPAEPDVQARIEEMLKAGEIVTKATVDVLRKDHKAELKDLRKEIQTADADAEAGERVSLDEVKALTCVAL